MPETRTQPGQRGPGADPTARLLAVVDRSVPPLRPVGDDLLSRWYVSSGTALPIDEWADPAASRLAETFTAGADLVDVEEAVVAFAQARAGCEHSAEGRVRRPGGAGAAGLADLGQRMERLDRPGGPHGPGARRLGRRAGLPAELRGRRRGAR